ncbi:MAG: zinc-binding alcohol dehydrogenase family protein [Elusimicrobiota bacterium]|jgi:L-gulonate 5-dehydrogenase|nr:zinc-binding alcohol dehydrogenase family protein [Elusimicrobiota bacterium]
MKVAKVYAKKDLRLEEIEKPSISKPTDVLVRPKFVGICGSDVHLYHGANPLAILPRIMGHEIVGVVEDMGKEVKGLAVGDHVVIDPISFCGKCYACRHNMPNVCEQLIVFGVQGDGGMREYFTIPEKQVLKFDKSLPWEEAVLIEPFTIGANATLRGNVGIGDTVVVFGAGPIGIAALKLAKIKGAAVMVTDIVDDKLDFAKKQGADIIVNTSKTDLFEAVKDWTKGEGANKVIDAVCVPKMLEDGVNILSPAGTFVNLSFNATPAQLAGLPITRKQLTIAGSRLQSYQFANVIRLMESGMLRGNGLVTQKFPFSDIQKAFDFIDANPAQVRKALLEFF